MPPSTRPCPRCGAPLTIPHPPPEKVACPGCKAVVRIAAPPKTKDIFKMETVLTRSPFAGAAPRDPYARAGAGAAATTAPAPARRGVGMLLAVGACFLVLLTGAVVAWATLGGGPAKEKGVEKERAADARETANETPRPEAPHVFIDEDFRQAVKDKQALPDGWTGDAFRVIVKREEPCLEVSKPSGDYFVKLPPVTLTGDFSIDGVCVLDHGHRLTLRLESRKTNALLPVVLCGPGQVVIGDDHRLAPPNFKPFLPIHFLVKREGKKLRVLLNDEAAVDKDLEAVVGFDSLQLGLTADVPDRATGSQVYRLKVAALPEK